jgi:2-oxoglutarate ferredoxin oxidoreductase subunit alpha
MSKKNIVYIRIAGAAGDGISSTAEIFGRTCTRQGLYVKAYNSYQSAIRGGYVWFHMAISSEKPLTHGEHTDILVVMNSASAAVHVPQVRSGGLVFYNSSVIKEDLSKMRGDVDFCALDFKAMTANDLNIKPIMANMMLLGCLEKLLNLDMKLVMDYIDEHFSKKGPEVAKLNHRVFQLGIDWVVNNKKSFDVTLKGDRKQRMLLTGNHAFGMGLLAHGIKFYAAYPMSPSTGILHYLANKARSDKIIVKQTEDEIAALNFCIGAAHAGVRAATATSGGGFSLMVEAVGLAGMLEEPVVVINVQRGGPSTGIPTKQEQGDINLVLGAAQSDIPRAIIAPKDSEDAFHTTGRAFNLAEKYQTPIIVLSDLYLSEHFETVEELRVKTPIERGKIQTQADSSYKRYLFVEDGVSPRVIPGLPGAMYVSASDEHDERGEVISDVRAGLPESLEVRNRIMEKRMKKLEMIRDTEMRPPEVVGPKDAELTLLGWGSTFGAIEEARLILGKKGLKVSHVHFTDLFPLPVKAVLEILENCKEIIAVENNYSSQFVRLLRAETGFDVKKTVNRYDGEPFTGEDIVNRLEKVIAHVHA